MPYFPLFKEIFYYSSEKIVKYLPQEGLLYLDSAHQTHQSRYSFIAFSPFKMLTCKNGLVTIDRETKPGDPFAILEEELARFHLKNHSDLPPFQGGVAGMFGYELGKYLEKLPSKGIDYPAFPEILLGFYDLVIGWDHIQRRAWLFSSGFGNIAHSREIHAEQRLAWALAILQDVSEKVNLTSEKVVKREDITSNFTQTKYIQAVNRVKEYIKQGDIFQANISQRFSVTLPESLAPFDLYLRLRRKNPSPFGAYLHYGDYSIVSQSPERFLQLTDGFVESRPIKGTRRRHLVLEKDEALAKELQESEKDRAENIMIVDLMRNDLSRVCLPHSVKVPALCRLESFTTVHHLVSVVQGTLMPNKKAIDLLKATFPGGSITGAPKIRAMEIIDEIEPHLRGPYCGSMGYIGFNGDMDLSITIRTFTLKNNIVTFQVGGAVTIDSDPLEEYQETLTKAKALHDTLINH